MDAQQVVEFLTAHPEFFNEQTELLESLRLRHPTTGEAISLLERQNLLLRDQLNQSQDVLEELIRNAKRNDRLFKQVRNLTLAIIPTQSMTDMAYHVTNRLVSDFEVHYACILWLADDSESLAIRPVDRLPDLPGWDHKQALCGPVATPSLANLCQVAFGTQADIGSVAAAPIWQQSNLLGMLVLANQSADHFVNSMDTLFLNHVANLIASKYQALNNHTR
ncbi:DUF484 family protein [Salinibius halmophilus]|uniref:DUF484 family protein n=1 Tax=Salinibius halmophilus TaxID=1853216 RepID=UPI000E6600CD|nr:DUF484 family protein [Salinibius halmophilus]